MAGRFFFGMTYANPITAGTTNIAAPKGTSRAIGIIWPVVPCSFSVDNVFAIPASNGFVVFGGTGIVNIGLDVFAID